MSTLSAQEIAIRQANNELPRIVSPSLFSTVLQHPVPFLDPSKFPYLKCQTMEITEPMKVYTKNARGFGERDYIDWANMNESFMIMRGVLGYIAYHCSREGTSTKVAFTIEFIPRRESEEQEIVSQSNETSYYQIEETEVARISATIKKQTFVNRFVAIRYRLTVHGSSVDFSSRIQMLIQENEKLAEDAKRHNRFTLPAPKEFSYRQLTMEKYISIVNSYNSRDYEMQLDIRDPKSAFNPVNAFNVCGAMVRTSNFGGDDQCCTSTLYREERNGIAMYVWPHEGQYVYLMNPAEMHPNEMNKFYFPFIKPPDHAPTGEQREWANTAALSENPRLTLFNGLPEQYFMRTVDEEGNPTVVPANPEDNAPTAEEAVQSFDRYTNKKSLQQPFDLNFFREMNLKRRAELEKRHPVDSLERKLALASLQIQQLTEFFDLLFNEHANIPDSIKAIARWGNKFLEKKNNFCMPMKRELKNVSPLAEKIANELIEYEVIFKAHSSHVDILRLTTAIYELYQNKPFHANQCDIGDTQKGKSFNMRVKVSQLIPGTYKEITSMTPKHLSGDKDNPIKNTMMVLFIEEMTPSVLGVHSSKGGHQVGTSNTDMEAMWKSILTKGRANFEVLVMTPDGNRNRVSIDVECNNLLITAMNAKLHDIPVPIQNRMFCSTAGAKKRKQNGGIINTVLWSNSSSSETMKRASIQRSRRDQYICCILGLLNYCEVEGFAFDRTASSAVITEVTNIGPKAPYYLTQTDSIRNAERVQLCVDALICMNAIAIGLDSELSILKNKKWNPLDIRHLAPYLCSTTEMASIALGLYEQQYEDTMSRQLEWALNQFVSKVPKSFMGKEPAKKKQKPIDVPSAMEDDEALFQAMATTPIPSHSQSIIPDVAGPLVQTMNRNPAAMAGAAASSSSNSNETALQPMQPSGSTLIDRDENYFYWNPTGSYRSDSRGQRSMWALVDIFARVLTHYFDTEPDREALIARIMDLTKESIGCEYVVEGILPDGTREKRTETKLRTILDIDTNTGEFRILKKYIEASMDKRLKKGKLYACLRSVLCHKYAAPNTVLYGRSDDTEPFLIQTMTIRSNPNRQLKIPDPNFHNDHILTKLNNSLQGATDEEGSMSKRFSRYQTNRINADIDFWASTTFVIRRMIDSNVISMVQLEWFGDNDVPDIHPMALVYRLNNCSRSDHLKTYPDDYRTSKRELDSSTDVLEEMQRCMDFHKRNIAVPHTFHLTAPTERLQLRSIDEDMNEERKEALRNEIEQAKQKAVDAVIGRKRSAPEGEGQPIGVTSASQLRLMQGDEPGEDIPFSQSTGMSREMKQFSNMSLMRAVELDELQSEGMREEEDGEQYY